MKPVWRGDRRKWMRRSVQVHAMEHGEDGFPHVPQPDDDGPPYEFAFIAQMFHIYTDGHGMLEAVAGGHTPADAMWSLRASVRKLLAQEKWERVEP